MLGFLLFFICNRRLPFTYVKEADPEETARKSLEVYRREIKQLQDRPAPSILPLAKDIYMQMLVLDPDERSSIQQVVDSPAFKQLKEEHPQPDERIFYQDKKYELIREIGQGGQGTAYIVRRWKEPADKMLLIVKMHNSAADYAEAKEESKRLREYEHENIVKVVDTFDIPFGPKKIHAIVMEYCNGKTFIIKNKSWRS